MHRSLSLEGQHLLKMTQGYVNILRQQIEAGKKEGESNLPFSKKKFDAE